MVPAGYFASNSITFIQDSILRFILTASHNSLTFRQQSKPLLKLKKPPSKCPDCKVSCQWQSPFLIDSKTGTNLIRTFGIHFPPILGLINWNANFRGGNHFIFNCDDLKRNKTNRFRKRWTE